MSVTLGEICHLITDGKHGDCQAQPGSGYYFLSCKDVREGKLTYDGAREITETDFKDTHRRTQLEPLDILITNSGTIGRMAMGDDSALTRRTTFQKSVAILKAKRERVDPHWLYYYLRCDNDRLVASAGGTAQKNLLLCDLRAFQMDVPPLDIQRQIARTMRLYDDLIENNTRRIRILEEMAAAIYREWFVHFRFPGHQNVRMIDSPVGKLPQGWRAGILGDVAGEVRRSVDPSEIDPTTPYFGLEHLPRKSITFGDWGFAKDVQSTKLAFREGEILFGKIRPYFHKVGVAPVDGVSSSDAIIIVPATQQAFGLVICCVSSDEFVAHATQTSQGTKMPRANWNVLVKYPVVIPPPDLLTRFDGIIRDFVSLAQNLMFRNRNLRKTRDLLLPKLISGEVDVSKLELEEATSA